MQSSCIPAAKREPDHRLRGGHVQPADHYRIPPLEERTNEPLVDLASSCLSIKAPECQSLPQDAHGGGRYQRGLNRERSAAERFLRLYHLGRVACTRTTVLRHNEGGIGPCRSPANYGQAVVAGK